MDPKGRRVKITRSRPAVKLVLLCSTGLIQVLPPSRASLPVSRVMLPVVITADPLPSVPGTVIYATIVVTASVAHSDFSGETLFKSGASVTNPVFVG